MSYPPQDGYQPSSTPPTVGFPAQPAPAPAPVAPSYPPALAQVSGTPYLSAPSPEPRRRPATLVLAIASAVLLVFGGLMLGLYLNERGNLGDTKSTLRDTRTDLTAQVNEQKAAVADLQTKLAEAQKRGDDLNAQLTTSKASLADMSAQRNALVPCMRRIQDAFDAAANGDSGGVTSALRQARTSCDKAEIKVDS